jgi:antitoxin (DNA-binding transcriptional repressor) of toxin-antitoxin stability system
MVNIADAKAKLSEYVDAVGRGEQVIICNRNRPVAELRAIEAPRAAPRDLTPMYRGQTFVTKEFFEPMSAAELEEWDGPDVFPGRVAERPARYVPSSSRPKRRKRRP